MSYTLDNIDRKILYELQANARIPETEIAKKVGKSKEAVGYRIRKMDECGAITGYVTWVDPTHLGYTAYKLYMRLANFPDQQKAMYEHLSNDPSVFWLSKGDGVWNLSITFFAKTRADFFEMKQRLSAQFPNLIMHYTMAEVVDVHVYHRDYLIEDVGKRERSSYILWGNESLSIDDVDKSIMRQLIRNARKPATEIAEQARVSPDTVSKRMRKMEQNGLIAQYTIGVDCHSAGKQSYKTFVYCRHFTKEDEKKLIAYIERTPQIVPLVRTIGPWDVELEIFADSYYQYADIINELEEIFPEMILNIESTAMRTDVVYPSGDIVLE